MISDKGVIECLKVMENSGAFKVTRRYTSLILPNSFPRKSHFYYRLNAA